MRKALSLKQKRNQTTVCPRRSRNAARRTRRLLAELLEPRYLLTPVTVQIINTSNTIAVEPASFQQDPATMNLATVTVRRTGSTQGVFPVGFMLSGSGQNPANTWWFEEMILTSDLDYLFSEDEDYVGACPGVNSGACFYIPDGHEEWTYNVIPLFDGIYEADETATITLVPWEDESESDYTIDTQNNIASVLIQDYTQYVTIESNGSATEGAGNTFTVRRHNWEGHPIGLGVFYSVSGPPNVTYADHQLTGGVFIPDDEDEVTLSVTPEQDCRDEEEEQITVTLTPRSISGGGPGNSGDVYRVSELYPSANMTIIDGDLPPLLYISDWEGDEGTASNPTTASFTITFKCASNPILPGHSDLVKSFWYSTQNGSALAGQDYWTVTNTRATFGGMGDTSTSVTLPLVDIKHDALHEDDEQFYVNLTNAENATIAPGSDQAVATILDNDSAPQINIDSVVVYEEELLATFTVSLTFAAPVGVSASYATEDISAVEPGDYTKVPATTVSFSPGETTKTITVKVVDDAEKEGTEEFRVRLSNLVYAEPGTTVGIGTIIDNDKPDDIPPSCSSCSTGGLGSLIGGGAPGVASSFGSPGVTTAPVRYADGTVLISSTDIETESFGMPWGITRSWTNGSGYAPPNIVGKGMMISEQPYLQSYNNDVEIAVITNSLTAHYFDLVNGDYTPRFFLQERLTKNTSEAEFILTDTSGAQIRFHDFSTIHPEAKRGQFKSYKNSNGISIGVTSWTTDGKIAEMQRSYLDGPLTYTDLFVYSYVTSGVNQGLLSSVAYKRQVGAGWITRQSVSYAYYGADEAFGNVGDLKTATVSYWGGGSDTTYYRYYEGDDPKGYAHGLKFVFYPASYARLAADISNPAAAADSAVDDYADHYFEYGLEHRAAKEIAQGAGCSSCSAGLGHFEFEYHDRSELDPSYVADPNSWAMRTTEELPDDNENIVYTNGDGQVMLELFVEAPGTPNEKKWGTFYRYDEDGRVKFRADPSAVSGYSESLPDLMGFNSSTNTYTYLNDTDGLITDFTYYGGTDPETGAAFGYLEYVKVREGDTDQSPSSQSLYKYESRTINGQTTYLVASSTVFENDDETLPLTTEYSYTGSNRIESQTTKDPTDAETTVIYDTFGRPTWTRDAAGFIHRIAYWSGSNAIYKITTDVNTAAIIDEPLGWTTPAGGGLHIVEMFSVDQHSRPTVVYDANENETGIEYNDSIRETITRLGFDFATSTNSGPTIITRDDRARGYVESRTMSQTIESLSRTYFNKAGQATAADAYFDFAGITYSSAANLGQENVNFFRTSFAYDQRGRLNRTERSDGMIYRTVYDGLGRPISEWIGDDDTGWLDATGADGMTEMQTYVYDNGGVGDSHLTSITDTLGRTTTFEYDYRGRVIKVTLPDPDTNPSQTGDIPDYETTYDNLGRVKTKIDPLDKETDYDYEINETTHLTTVIVTLPDPDGSIENSLESSVIKSIYDARGLLVRQIDPEQRETEYAYDGAGRLVKVKQVNPGEPTSLPTIYEYDDAGNLRFVTDPLQNVTERVYDELNRLTDVYAPDPDGPGNPLERSQTHYAYDAAGRLLSLTDPVGNATTWYYDALGRVKQETNQIGHSRYFEYDAASRLDQRTDRLGRVIEFDYNTLDQVTEERWKVGELVVRTLTHNYDAAGQLRGASDPAAEYDYLPDGLGRLETQTQAIAGFSPSFDIEYVSGYNLAGSRESLQASLGNTPNFTPDFQNSYGYDYLQRLKSLTQQGQALAGANTVAEKHIQFEYFASGQFETIGRYADAAGAELVANTFYKYDALGRLESMIHSEDAEPPTAGGWGTDPLAGYIYIYDGASRIERVNSVHIVNANDINETSIYQYDNTNQLTSADHDAQDDESYAYDANGNRIGGGYVTGLNNQLASDGTYNYVYDAEGNRVLRTNIGSGVITRYRYDHRNRLAGVEDFNPAVGSPENWGTSSGNGTVEIPNPAWQGGWGSNASWLAQCWIDVSSPSEGDDIVIMGQTCGYQDIAFSFEDGSAEDGIDFVGINGSFHIGTNGDPVQYGISTIDDAIVETIESFTVRVWIAGQPYTEISIEAYIYDNDPLVDEFIPVSYSAAVSPAVEGMDVVLTTTADTAVDFEYYVEDVSAYRDTDYTDAGSSSSSNWMQVSNGQIAFPTIVTAGNQGSRSFAIYVRVMGYPESERVLEADIYDRDEVTVKTVDYAYDVNNLLVRRTHDDDGPLGENEPTDTFFSWESGQIVFQFDTAASAEPSHRYLWNPLATDQIFADENALNEVLWTLTDHLGTTRDLVTYDFVTQAATIASHRVFDTFGVLVSPPDANFQIIFGFTGVYFDIAIGHSYHRNRWYDPRVGRWLSEDPIGFDANDTNLGRYLGNSPVDATDPTGLIKFPKGIRNLIQIDRATAEFVLENGKRIKIRNAQFISSSVTLDDLATLTNVAPDRIKRLRDKFPGLTINFDDCGYPNFSKHAKWTTKVFPQPNVSNYADLAWADLKSRDLTKYNQLHRNRDNYRWHHAKDGSLQLIDADLHMAYQHTGLNSILNSLASIGIVMAIPGIDGFKQGDVNAGMRDTIWGWCGASLLPDAISGTSIAGFDWFWDDLYGSGAQKVKP